MIIVNILGGLGNQMFQYAFGYAVSKKKNEVLKLDINSFELYDLRKYELGLFTIDTDFVSIEEVNKLKYKDENILGKFLRKIGKKERMLAEQYYKEPHFNFDENVWKTKDDIYFEGYWQSEKYFKEYREDLLKQFTLQNKLHPKSQDYSKIIKETESVSLHIRRGDYVTNVHTNSVHGTCSLDYYKNAVFKIYEKIINPHFFIFSDDMKWAKENFAFIGAVTFVELAPEVPDHEEMYLMSQCKHNIIANSSFSWWGAWLNQNSDKTVIAPKQWFNDQTIDTSDLIPEDWLQL